MQQFAAPAWECVQRIALRTHCRRSSAVPNLIAGLTQFFSGGLHATFFFPMGPHMHVVKKSRNIVAAILAGYFCVGILTRATGEIFPVWSWFLFANVPQIQTHYSALLLEVEGKELPKPVLYQEGSGLVPQPTSATAAALMDRLGKALETNSAESENLRQTLETNFLPGVKRYSVVKMTWRPLDYYRTKAHERKDIATFEVKKP
jgi:hypothetical protein